MNVKDFIKSGILEEYALGLCDPADKQLVISMCEKYPEVKKALFEAEAGLEEVFSQQQLNEALQSSSTEPKIIPHKSKIKFRIHPAILKWGAAACLVSALAMGYMYSKEKSKNSQMLADLKSSGKVFLTLPESDYAVLNNPKITPIAMYGVGSHAICRCTIYWDKKAKKLYMIIHHLPRSSSSKDYQLWAKNGDSYKSIGIINDEIRGRFIEMNNAPNDISELMVTLEIAGGNTKPDLNDVYLEGRI